MVETQYFFINNSANLATRITLRIFLYSYKKKVYMAQYISGFQTICSLYIIPEYGTFLLHLQNGHSFPKNLHEVNDLF